MSLFGDDDFEKFIEKSTNSVPDGVVDGTSYINIFSNFANYLAMLDPEDEQSRVLFMMNTMNLIDNNDPTSAYEVLSACCYHVVTLLSAGIFYNENFKEIYMKMVYDEIIPNLSENASTMPYWD
jgi:hypothetical protein